MVFTSRGHPAARLTIAFLLSLGLFVGPDDVSQAASINVFRATSLSVCRPLRPLTLNTDRKDVISCLFVDGETGTLRVHAHRGRILPDLYTDDPGQFKRLD